nr:ArsB/NhaD family transporter [Gammaproteobacteria bacterium]
MHGQHDVISPVIFGWDPIWISVVLFIATYLVIISERLNRAVAALLGAGLMIVSGVLTQEAAIRGIDFNTLGLLTGMMVIVAITRRCGLFQYVAMWSAKRVRAHPGGLLVMLSAITALFSALLDNVTTVLLIGPVTLLITAELEVNPYPFLFAEIFASNLGGTATLIGDPPNIMIGSAAGLTFNDFLLNLAPIIPPILLITLIIIYAIWRTSLRAEEGARQRIMAFDERKAITDVRLLKQALSVLSLVLLSFLFAHPLHLEPATIAMFGAAALLLLDIYSHGAQHQSETVQRTLSEVEWVTIFFFVGLFILVQGLERTGVLEVLARAVLSLTEGDRSTTAFAILWISAIASAVVDNIPFVATMIPIIESMASTFGGDAHLNPLWWSLALGACLGGNGSIIGASANVIAAGLAERAGHPIPFMGFLRIAFPLMLLSILLANIYLYLRYFG